MKAPKALSVILIVLCLFGMEACKSSRSVSMNVTRPADIDLPDNIKTLVVLDRSKFKKGAINIVEGILTGELPNEDRNAAAQGVTSLYNMLSQSPRFEVLRAQERLEGNNVGAAFPPKLLVGQIRQICTRYGADALVSMELFDTDFIVTNGARRVKKTVGTGKDRKEVMVNEYYAEGIGSLKIGLRVYDGQRGTILDEHFYKETRTWNQTGTSKRDALVKLINKADANTYLAREISADYAYRIAPQPIRVSRTFYSKARKAPEIAQGSRYADVGNWKRAAEVWRSGIDHAPTKEAGYLAYNIAIANEVLGDIELAIQWAEEAYTAYGNSKARQYSSILKQRRQQDRIAEEQLRSN